MKFRFFLLILATMGPLALGGVYSYRDEKGTLHAVSSPDEIPERYRANVKQLSSEESGSGDVNLKLEREGNSLIIPVSFGAGVEAPMILDTGASVSMISTSLAERLKVKQLGLTQISTASGIVRVPVVKLPETSVRQFTVRDLRVTVNNLPSGRAQGLLGVDFLKHFRMQLDSESGQLHLERK